MSNKKNKKNQNWLKKLGKNVKKAKTIATHTVGGAIAPNLAGASIGHKIGKAKAANYSDDYLAEFGILRSIGNKLKKRKAGKLFNKKLKSGRKAKSSASSSKGLQQDKKMTALVPSQNTAVNTTRKGRVNSMSQAQKDDLASGLTNVSARSKYRTKGGNISYSNGYLAEFFKKKKKDKDKKKQTAAGVAGKVLTGVGMGATLPMIAMTKRGSGVINSALSGIQQRGGKGLKAKANKVAADIGDKLSPKILKDQAKEVQGQALNTNLPLQTVMGIGGGGIAAGNEARKAISDRKTRSDKGKKRGKYNT